MRVVSEEDSLSRYRAKRDFKISAEPNGPKASSTSAPIFVIQRHHASNLHYDFRLELNGTLKSWAVPKGPSLDPNDKRLAVHVEDHPLAYATFEGTIPAKQYGAGEVVLWDRGVWHADGNAAAAYKAGKLKFELLGEKLHGHWTLVRTRMGKAGEMVNAGNVGKENWLLIKERDAEAKPAAKYDVTVARPESVNTRPIKRAPAVTKRATSRAEKKVHTALPDKIAPQLATLVAHAPAGDDWAYELKLDGYRILMRIDHAGKVRALSRNGLDWTDKMPAVVKAVTNLGLKNTWLDGEVVVLDKQGKPVFQLLQNAFATKPTKPIQYFLFDIPFANGQDLRGETWTNRRAALDAVMKNNRSALIGVTEALPAPVADIWSNVCHHGLEGLIGKRRDAPYSNGRSTSWIKLKCGKRQEFVIGGYTEPKGSRTAFGALLLGVHEDGKLRENGKLRYAGRVGTGFDESRLTEMHKAMKARQIDHAPFANAPTGADARGVRWVKPDLVGEVSFAEWTKEGVIRHAVFQGLRTDKPATEIGIEKAQRVSAHKVAKTAAKPAAKGSVATASGIVVSHPERVIDASSGFTKLDLVLYYEKIADCLLPHLRDRPVAMLRVPENIKSEQFFQKHLDKYVIPGALKLPDLDPGHAPVIVLNNVKALAGAAQMNVVELHTWNALAKSVEKPDRVIFDLDPDPALPWERVVEAVKLTRTLLEELGLKIFLKTSGGKGMHIVVPLLRKHRWDAARDFAHAVSRHLAQTIPDRFSAKMGPKNRVGRVFVDYLRNSRGATTVCAFSARARAGIPVSVPISWDELETISRSDQWNILTVHDHLVARKKDPWADYEKSRQSLSQAIKLIRGS